MFDDQISNLYYNKDFKTINTNKKTILTKVCQAIKRKDATLTRVRKTRKTNID